jgi:hypothetical protein
MNAWHIGLNQRLQLTGVQVPPLTGPMIVPATGAAAGRARQGHPACACNHHHDLPVGQAQAAEPLAQAG